MSLTDLARLLHPAGAAYFADRVSALGGKGVQARHGLHLRRGRASGWPRAETRV